MAIQTTANALSRDLARIIRKTERKFLSVVSKTVFDLHDKIIERTPTETGRAAGSWGISEGAAGRGSLPEGEYPNPRQSAQQFVSVMGFRRFTKIWIWNNIPYITMLEFGLYPGDGPKTVGGFSKKAPQGMVRLSIIEQRLIALAELRRVL